MHKNIRYNIENGGEMFRVRFADNTACEPEVFYGQNNN